MPSPAMTLAAGVGSPPNPVQLHELNPPTVRKPATEAEQVTRDPALGTEVNRRLATGVAGNVPMTEPGPTPSRPGMHALAMFLPVPDAPPSDHGTHATFEAGAAFPGAIGLSTGDPQRGNSFRLAPAPWDTPLFTAVQGSEGNVPQ